MPTEDIEQRELVYLINYAKTQPDLVILAVNTFVRDPDDQNPFICALAIRTVAYASKRSSHTSPVHYRRVYMTKTHMRKTAALCIAKLYDLKPELALENGFIEQLSEMILDSNPMVLVSFHHVCVVV